MGKSDRRHNSPHGFKIPSLKITRFAHLDARRPVPLPAARGPSPRLLARRRGMRAMGNTPATVMCPEPVGGCRIVFRRDADAQPAHRGTVAESLVIDSCEGARLEILERSQPLRGRQRESLCRLAPPRTTIATRFASATAAKCACSNSARDSASRCWICPWLRSLGRLSTSTRKPRSGADRWLPENPGKTRRSLC